MDSVGRFGIHV